MIRIRAFLLACLLTLIPVGARGEEGQPSEKNAAAETTELKIPLSEKEALVIRQPKAFQFRVTRDPDDGFRPALAFNAFADGVKTHGLKLFIEKDAKSEVENVDQLKTRLEKVGGRYVASSVEKKVNAEELKVTVKDGFGCYCVLTDPNLVGVKDPLPGDFACMTFVFVKLNGFVVHGRLYSNSKDDAGFRDALRIMETVSIGTPDPPKPETPSDPSKADSEKAVSP